MVIFYFAVHKRIILTCPEYCMKEKLKWKLRLYHSCKHCGHDLGGIRNHNELTQTRFTNRDSSNHVSANADYLNWMISIFDTLLLMALTTCPESNIYIYIFSLIVSYPLGSVLLQILYTTYWRFFSLKILCIANYVVDEGFETTHEPPIYMTPQL
jgi:hypothetical protein